MRSGLRRALGAAVCSLLTVGALSAVGSAPANAAQPSVGGPANTLPSAVPSAATPSVDNGAVFATAQVGNSIVLGGTFTSVGGQTHNRIAIFDRTTGALSSVAPDANSDVNAVIPGPTANTVYLGGAFTSLNGTATQFIAELDITTGSIVPSFKAPAFDFGFVNDMVARNGRLYIGGSFGHVGGKVHTGLASLNGTTGALDPFMNVQLSGHHNDTPGGAQGWLGPWSLDATPDGRTMVVIGNFKYANVGGGTNILHDQVIMLDLSGASAAIDNWNTNRYAPYCFSWAFDSYVRGVNFSPDGSYFVVNATGGGNPGTLCDGTTRWETNPNDANAQPTWVDETGGDTVWAVAVTNTAIFVGGHNRWENNPGGADHALPGAVPRPGLAALDPATGRPFAWNPGRNPLGTDVFSLLATSDGVWVGSDTMWIGNFKYKRPRIAFFPYAGGYTPASTATASLPGTVYLGGSKGTGQTNVLYRVDTGGPAIQAIDNGPDWAADTSDPSSVRNSGSNAAQWSPGAAETSAVPSTTPNAIFDSERWSPSDNPPMDWAFPVAAGTPIEVRLYFANRYSGTSAVGQRVFNVALDGTPVLNNYDIVADAGADQTGTMKKFDITSDGTVNIDFSHVTENPLINGIEIVRTDITPPPPTSVDNLGTVAFDGTTATASNVDNQGVDFGNWRGAFLVGSKVYYGYTDGYLYSRTFTGGTFGPAQKIDPYNDPIWSDVDSHDGTTFRGALPTLYGQLPNVTGMAYVQGRLYYTLFGDANLYSRWFLPDSSIVDETAVTSSSSVDFSDADGMFVSGGNLYYGSRSDGNLRRVGFTGGAVSGTPAVVSGPGVDGVRWTNRALFLAAANHAPTAAFSSGCNAALGCTFDGTGSTDSDGTISSYAWNFGDGGTATGATASHTYTTAGTYHVTLTVTDNQGATGTVTHDVSPTVQTSSIGFVAAANGGGGAVKAKQVIIPTQAAVGNTALLFLTRQTTATWTGPTGVAGWTAVGSYANSSLTTTVWSKTLAAGDVGATVSFANTAYDHASLDVAVYSGVNAANPIAAFTQAQDTAKASHVTSTATVGSTNWVVSFWADRSQATRTWTVPASVQSREASTDTGSLTVQAVIADSNGPVTSGSYGALTATTDANTDRTAMWTIVLNPS